MVIRCQNDIAELQQILMGLINSSRSWSKEGSAEKQGYLSGKDKRKFNRIVNIYKILVI